MPLFDHKVVELAMGLPLDAKLHNGEEKWALRKAFEQDLPRSITERRKQAFLAPPAPFRSPEGKMMIETYLSGSALRETGIWAPPRIAALKLARSLMPQNKLVNLLLTIVLTTQILADKFVLHQPIR